MPSLAEREATQSYADLAVAVRVRPFPREVAQVDRSYRLAANVPTDKAQRHSGTASALRTPLARFPSRGTRSLLAHF
eukprot:1782833-Rhodomonas_salina.1